MANTKPRGSGKPINRNLDFAAHARPTQNGDFISQPISIVIEANADMVDKGIFIANRRWAIVGISEVHRVKGTDGSAVTLGVQKCTGTTAPGSGTNLLTSNFDLKGNNSTVQAGALTNVSADRILDIGDRLALDFVGVQTSVAGVCVTVDLVPY